MLVIGRVWSISRQATEAASIAVVMIRSARIVGSTGGGIVILDPKNLGIAFTMAAQKALMTW